MIYVGLILLILSVLLGWWTDRWSVVSPWAKVPILRKPTQKVLYDVFGLGLTGGGVALIWISSGAVFAIASLISKFVLNRLIFSHYFRAASLEYINQYLADEHSAGRLGEFDAPSRELMDKARNDAREHIKANMNFETFLG